MAEQRYWFARRFPVGHPRNAMVPISPEGWWVVGAFMAAITIGGLSLLAFGLNGQFLPGIILFVVLATLGGGILIGMTVKRGDSQHTVADYKAGRVS